MRPHFVIAIVWGLFSASSFAEFDSTRVKSEPVSVAERYPDPAVIYATPGLKAGRLDFASHAEVMSYLKKLAHKYPDLLTLQTRGMSQQGREIPLLILMSKKGQTANKPTVLFLGQQHGNEPAGGEGALALAEQLLEVNDALLEQVNVLIMPRANPDAAEHFVRATVNGLDVNRDHLLLQTPEARAIAAVALQYQPQVVVDMHEFTVGDRWLAKFGAYAKYDALLQAATVGNMDAKMANLALSMYVGDARLAIEQQGLTSFWYHTSSSQAADRVISMGGVQADTGRNVYGLRHAVSVLIETRGVGLGRAHFLRRVHTHVLAGLAIVKRAAQDGKVLVSAVAKAGQATAIMACQGEFVVQAQATAEQQRLTMVDAVSGLDRDMTVDWRSALSIKTIQTRSRPCGYWIAADQVVAVQTLQLLGVRVTALPTPIVAKVERYVITSERGGQRQDARGAIAAVASEATSQTQEQITIRELSVSTESAKQALAAGGWYVPLNQAMAHLAIVALEPDSQNSLAANRILDIHERSLLRVMSPELNKLRVGR
jgi:hypothetical protein